MLLPAVQEFNGAAVPELYMDLAEAMGVGVGPDGTPADAVAATLGAIRQLAADVGIPRNLAELGE